MSEHGAFYENLFGRMSSDFDLPSSVFAPYQVGDVIIAKRSTNLADAFCRFIDEIPRIVTARGHSALIICFVERTSDVGLWHITSEMDF